MTTAIIIIGILFIFLIGFIQLFRTNSRTIKKHEFASEYRNKFIELANKYFEQYDKWSKSGNLDNELYVWLTKNVSKIQSNAGSFGVMSYKPAFQNYMINNYQLIINTIPKFREGQVENSDVTSVDDCLLRYIGHIEERSEQTLKNLKNPIIWFRIGFQEIISIPLFVLNWFGIFSKQRINGIMESTIYKIFTGIIALITLLSGLVTIIQGKEKTFEFINRIIGN
jgi:hypothetical protein